MIAQRRAFITRAEQAAPLQLGHEQARDRLEAGRQQRRHQVEAVGGVVLEPVLQDVGHVAHAADGGQVAATAGDLHRELTERQAAVVAELRQQLLAAALAAVGERQFGSGASQSRPRRSMLPIIRDSRPSAVSR